MAAAEAWQQREEFFRAVGQAFQDGEEAQENLAYALGRWGEDRAIEILQKEAGRVGQVRGSMLTADGWRVGAAGARSEAADALEKLPGLLRKVEQSKERAATARDAYIRYCHETGRDPERRTAEERATDRRQPQASPDGRPPAGGEGGIGRTEPQRPSYWESFQREAGQGEDDPGEPSIERERSR